MKKVFPFQSLRWIIASLLLIVLFVPGVAQLTPYRLTGQVLLKENDLPPVPLPGITVKAVGAQGQTVTALTDAKGVYTLSLSPGAYQLSAELPPDISPKPTPPQVVTITNSNTCADITYVGLRTVFPIAAFVRFVNNGGGVRGPAAGMDVQIRQSSGLPTLERKTDAAGEFRISLPRGAYSIYVRTPFGRLWGPFALVVQAPIQSLNIDVPTARISGRVIGPNGEIVSGASVAWKAAGGAHGNPAGPGPEDGRPIPPVTTDESGGFIFDLLIPDSYFPTIQPPKPNP